MARRLGFAPEESSLTLREWPLHITMTMSSPPCRHVDLVQVRRHGVHVLLVLLHVLAQLLEQLHRLLLRLGRLLLTLK